MSKSGDVERDVESVTERLGAAVYESVTHMEGAARSPNSRSHLRVVRADEVSVPVTVGPTELEEEVQPGIAGKLADSTQR
jgi:hypothetical protein